MLKISLINADDAIKSYIKYSSLSEGIYQALIAKPHEIARLVRIAVSPQQEGIIQTHYPLVVCQIFQNYPYLLLVLFSIEGNANSLFEFLDHNPNQTQLGYFLRIISLFNSSTQQEGLRYLKQNQNILSLCFNNIHIPSVFRFLFDCTILCKKEYQIRSIILIKLYKEIIIDPTQQLAQSIKDTLAEIIENYGILGNTIKQTLCNIFDQEYVKEIGSIVVQGGNSEVEEYCASILNKIVIIYFGITKEIANASITSSSESNPSTIKQNQVTKLKTSAIQSGIKQILKSLKALSKLLIEPSHSTHTNQLCERVPNITVIKFKLSQLFKTIVKYFSLSELNQYQIDEIQLLRGVIRQINVNPWANLVHNQLTEISTLIIQKKRNWDQSIIQVLHELMDLFKNRYYIFLNSGATIYQGNTHHLYLIIKKLSVELDNNQQLEGIFHKSRAWKKFLVEDIQKYQESIKLDAELYPRSEESLAESTVGNLIVKISERNSNCLINQFINDLNDSYVSVQNYTVWDRKKESLT